MPLMSKPKMRLSPSMRKAKSIPGRRLTEVWSRALSRGASCSSSSSSTIKSERGTMARSRPVFFPASLWIRGVAKPARNMRAINKDKRLSICCLLSMFLGFLHFLFDVAQLDVHLVFVFQVGGQAFGGIHRAMLTSCTTKIDHKMFKAAFDVFVHRTIDQIPDSFQEIIHFIFLFEKGNDLRYLPCFVVLSCIADGFVHRTAVEHKTASVAAEVDGNATSVGKAVDGNGEGRFRRYLQESLVMGHLLQGLPEAGKVFLPIVLLHQVAQVFKGKRNAL